MEKECYQPRKNCGVVEMARELSHKEKWVWANHADLQKAFPGVDQGRNVAEYLEWYYAYIISEPHRLTGYSFTPPPPPEKVVTGKRKLIRLKDG